MAQSLLAHFPVAPRDEEDATVDAWLATLDPHSDEAALVNKFVRSATRLAAFDSGGGADEDVNPLTM